MDYRQVRDKRDEHQRQANELTAAVSRASDVVSEARDKLLKVIDGRWLLDSEQNRNV